MTDLALLITVLRETANDYHVQTGSGNINPSIRDLCDTLADKLEKRHEHQERLNDLDKHK